MIIETVLIDDLDLDPRNARKHDAKNLKAIADSLEQFGQRKPIVVWGRTVVAGNGTMAAARSLGWKEISIARVPDDWSADQVKAYALADNRSAELAEWDEQVLAAQLLELTEAEFDVELLGFELPVDELAEVVEDELPEQVEPKSKLGDVWKLGRHMLLCDDAINSKIIERWFTDGIDSLVTDPPYGMSFQSNYRKEQHKAIANDDTALALEWASNLSIKHSRYIFCRWDNLKDVAIPTSLITWVKNNWSMGDLEHSHARKTEVALFYPGTQHFFPDGRPSDVVEFARTQNELHPTQKPIDLMAQVVRWTDGIVFDPFAGSGSTLIACEQLSRTCFAVELDPKYVDVIIARWEKLTGEQAQLIEG
jgi:site-specific DNA-methyltransferase (adenine-specific)